MNLIKLEDLNVVPLEEIRRKSDKKHGKVILDIKINEIGEELNVDEIESNLVTNVVLKPKEFGEPSRRNTHFIRPKYAPPGQAINFFFGFISSKATTFEETTLSQLTKHDIS